MELSPRAVADLQEIGDYIARDNPRRAVSFVRELEAECEAVAHAPELYPARHGLAPGVRMGTHGRYVILFRMLVDSQVVRIERVLHGARNLPRLVS